MLHKFTHSFHIPGTLSANLNIRARMPSGRRFSRSALEMVGSHDEGWHEMLIGHGAGPAFRLPAGVLREGAMDEIPPTSQATLGSIWQWKDRNGWCVPGWLRWPSPWLRFWLALQG